MIERHNPARVGELVGSVAATSPDGVDAVVRAAAHGQRAWAAVAADERASVLRRAADAVAPHVEELAVLLARESGKPLADCRGEVGFALTYLRWTAGRAPALLADREIDDDAGRLLLQRKPYGVVAAITPWNAPVILTMLKVAPALAAGNAIVVKPSPLAPLAIDRVLRLLADALPDGLLHAVHGGGETGAALVGHRLVRKVAFTGGAAAASQVAATAALLATPTVLELGGNDPVLLLPDADLGPEPMRRLVLASFATSGQVCMAAKRLYVHRSRYDEFLESYQDAARSVLRTGDPLHDGVSMGPVITAEAAHRVRGLVDDAVARGGRAIPLGLTDPATDLGGGHFVLPTLVVDAPADAPVVTEEQFGPVVPLLAYDDVDDLVERANAGELGLGASVWSADEDRAFALARRIEAGFVFVNTHNRTGMSLRAPFGGVKRSGYGREYGDEGITEYAQTCVVHAPAAFRAGGAGAAANAYPT
ncbi:acyl-CoA reductase-like NAD-dependent aldehyde dehydrogenase [Allocatelliglobosispora scoriae]|uniref:Acyl-CoA reductase-like NAD-dependent aldehyde dehydrogenase n=1 Tax=Allocatelliglobosispora scoriae TaxID=643052 RepID=A0A841C3D5_9ACTN|nr:aldehyde dehydrogenase family protein [Allocatelliglobosispora scoriae]MBB5873351.1 acyl-CoA reductase-like NAD-dependent aldehyde dehydrogenase [Allocatelliglobosispora scoriae]